MYEEKIRAWLGKSIKTHKIFIVGTGRSGTHWAGHTLAAHPSITATIEEKEIFNLVKTAATNPSQKSSVMPKIIKFYRRAHMNAVPSHYLDKSHPNIWLVEELENKFDDALFIGIQRDAYQVVSSMLQHKILMDTWYTHWEEMGVPNEFMGVDNSNLEDFKRASLAGKATFRWISHTNRHHELLKKMPKKYLLINHDQLMADTDNQLKIVEEFIGLTKPLPKPAVDNATKHKWKNNLTSEQKKEIDSILQKYYVTV